MLLSIPAVPARAFKQLYTQVHWYQACSISGVATFADPHIVAAEYPLPARASSTNRNKLIVVSNRLPVTLSHEGKNWSAKPSSGGLATAMLPILKQMGGLWIGWPGDDGTIDTSEREQILASVSDGYRFVAADGTRGRAGIL